MKSETATSVPAAANNKTNGTTKMAFDLYPNISGKQRDPVREVVMKYIDYFLPE